MSMIIPLFNTRFIVIQFYKMCDKSQSRLLCYRYIRFASSVIDGTERWLTTRICALSMYRVTVVEHIKRSNMRK